MASLPPPEKEKQHNSSPVVDHELDITAEVCPITFVRTKLRLESMEIGQVLRVRLRRGEPLHNVPRALLDHGQEILALEPVDEDVYELLVRKCR